MRKMKKAQDGNKTVRYKLGEARRSMFGKKYPIERSVDTTGYSGTTKKYFKATDELMRNKPGKPNPTKTGGLSRKGLEEGMRKSGITPKKTYGGKAQNGYGPRCGPGGCRQTWGMSGYGSSGGGGRRGSGRGLLKRIFAPNRKTGGTTKKK